MSLYFSGEFAARSGRIRSLIGEANKDDSNPLGSIFDIPLPDRYKHLVSDKNDNYDSNETSSEEEDDECIIKYFFENKFDSATCWLQHNICYLEYQKWRSVIPDKNRCVLKNNKCTLMKEVKGVMLPFAKKDCDKFWKISRKSLDPEDICIFRYIDELERSDLSCQMKNNDCYLGNEMQMTIIKDEENCKMEDGICMKVRDFETDIPFVSKKCHKFDQPIKKRKRSIYYRDVCEIYPIPNIRFLRNFGCQLFYDECFLEIENMISFSPDNDNCLRQGDRCDVIIPFRNIHLPMVEKNCWRLNAYEAENSYDLVDYDTTPNFFSMQNAHYDDKLFHESTTMSEGFKNNYFDQFGQIQISGENQF